MREDMSEHGVGGLPNAAGPAATGSSHDFIPRPGNSRFHGSGQVNDVFLLSPELYGENEGIPQAKMSTTKKDVT